MTNSNPAHLTTWLIEPLGPDVKQSVDRLRKSDDVRHVALMPDVHLARDVCIGAVVATTRLIYPPAIGGDIGCGMVSLAFDAEASVIDNEKAAARVLTGLYQSVPSNKHRRPRELPPSLGKLPLSDPRLQTFARRDGRVQLGTLGRGNHFLEFQADQDGRLWVMIHSGSRGVGRAVTDHHLKSARHAETGLQFLDSTDVCGQLYLADVDWARTYAAENRLAMLRAVDELMQSKFGFTTDWDSLIHCDHNHIQQELHGGEFLWVHRKGAQSAKADEFGIVPGSMGTVSFHTQGRGNVDALMSCSHGAGRAMSRSEARQNVSRRQFARQVGNLWYDHRRAEQLRDEAPSAYKNIREVMKAQRSLTRTLRELRPLLTYKGN